MGKIISVSQLPKFVTSLKKLNKTTVLAGGCFDVLHPGHVIFLEKAKKAGDCLVVLLESDEKVKQLKGVKRPVHTQMQRAQVLAALQSVDYVVLLPFMESDFAYDALIQQIKPAIIAATKGDVHHHQQRAAKLAGAKLKFVTKLIGNHSTSRILDC